MRETELSARQILMVVLAVVVLIGGLLAYVFTVLPSVNEPVESRRWAAGSGVVAGLAAAWFVKLAVDAVRDRRRGIDRGPATVSGWFHVGLGTAAAAGGTAGSVLAYQSAVAAGGGIWTLYYGLIGWGVVEVFYGRWRVGHERAERGGAGNGAEP